jgi:hypothetical protein
VAFISIHDKKELQNNELAILDIKDLVIERYFTSLRYKEKQIH